MRHRISKVVHSGVQGRRNESGSLNGPQRRSGYKIRTKKEHKGQWTVLPELDRRVKSGCQRRDVGPPREVSRAH